MYKTNYLRLHEQQYKRKKVTGCSGWSDESAVKEMGRIVHYGLHKKKIKKGKFLELGCGDGSIALSIASATDLRIYGIDIVPMAIQWVRDKSRQGNRSAEFITGSVTALPYENCFFDVVLDADCSHCIIGRDRKLFFSEAFRVLKPNGLFILVALCGEPASELTDYFDPASRCLVKNGIAGRYYGLPESIILEAETAGFTVIEWDVELCNEQQELVMYCSSGTYTEVGDVSLF